VMNATRPVVVAFKLESSANTEWSFVEERDTAVAPLLPAPLAAGRSVDAKYRKNRAGLTGPEVQRARVVTDENGCATVEFNISGFAGEVHKVGAYIVDAEGEEQPLYTDEYQSWRRMFVETWTLDAGKRHPSRPAEEESFILVNYPTASVNIKPLQDTLKKAFIDVVEEPRGSMPRDHKNVVTRGDTFAPFPPSTKMHGDLAKAAVAGFGVQDYRTTTAEKLMFKVGPEWDARQLSQEYFYDESKADKDDWFLRADATWSVDFRPGYAAVDGKYLAGDPPRKLSFSLGQFSRDFKIPSGTEVELLVEYHPSRQLYGFCAKDAAWIASNWNSGSGIPADDVAATLTHEIGHAMGLEHHKKTRGCTMFAPGYAGQPATFCPRCIKHLRAWEIKF